MLLQPGVGAAVDVSDAPVMNLADSEHRNAAMRPKSLGTADGTLRRCRTVATERPDPLGVVTPRLQRVHGDAVAGDLAGEGLQEAR